jgi:hypothetical protein
LLVNPSTTTRFCDHIFTRQIAADTKQSTARHPAPYLFANVFFPLPPQLSPSLAVVVWGGNQTFVDTISLGLPIDFSVSYRRTSSGLSPSSFAPHSDSTQKGHCLELHLLGLHLLLGLRQRSRCSRPHNATNQRHLGYPLHHPFSARKHPARKRGPGRAHAPASRAAKRRAHHLLPHPRAALQKRHGAWSQALHQTLGESLSLLPLTRKRTIQTRYRAAHPLRFAIDVFELSSKSLVLWGRFVPQLFHELIDGRLTLGKALQHAFQAFDFLLNRAHRLSRRLEAFDLLIDRFLGVPGDPGQLLLALAEPLSLQGQSQVCADITRHQLPPGIASKSGIRPSSRSRSH